MVCSKFYYFKNFNSCKMLKMLKINSLELFEAKLLYLRYASTYSNTIFSSTVVKVWLLCPVSHIFTVVCSKFYYFKNFNSWKMLKMLKIGCLTKITVSQVCLKVFQYNFLLNSGESQVTVTSFTHIHNGLLQILLFQKFQ